MRRIDLAELDIPAEVIEKMDAMRLCFTEEDIEAQMKVKRAFDPKDLSNPGKIFPVAQEVAHAS